MGGPTCFRCQKQISPFHRLISRLCRECDRCNECGAPLARDTRRLAMAGLARRRGTLCQMETARPVTQNDIARLARRRGDSGRDDYPFLCRSCRDKWLLEISGANGSGGYPWDKRKLFRWDSMLSETDIAAFLRTLEVTPLQEIPPHKPRVEWSSMLGAPNGGRQCFGTQHVGGEHHAFTEREVQRDLWAMLEWPYGRSYGGMLGRFIAESIGCIDRAGMTAHTLNLENWQFRVNDHGFRVSLRADVEPVNGVFDGALAVFRTGEHRYLVIYQRSEHVPNPDK